MRIAIALICLLASSLSAQKPTCGCSLAFRDSSGHTTASAVGEVGKPWTSQLALTSEFMTQPRFRSRGLPPGLELDAESGKLTGTPTKAGVYTVEVSVQDAKRGMCADPGNTDKWHTWSFELVIGKTGRIEYERLCRKGSSDGARLIGADTEFFGRAIELRPDLDKAWGLRGKALISDDEFKAAIDDLDRALALRPKVAKYYLYRGRARLGAKMISEGLGDFATAGRLATNDYQVAMEAGEVLEKQELHADAETAYTSAITAKETERAKRSGETTDLGPLLEAYLARHRVRLAAKNTKGAIADLTRCIALDKNCVKAQVELSHLIAAEPGGAAVGNGSEIDSREILAKVRVVFEVASKQKGFDALDSVVDWPSVYETEAGVKRRFKSVAAFVASRRRRVERARRPAITAAQVDRIMSVAKVTRLGPGRAVVRVRQKRLCTVERIDGQWRITRFMKLR